MHTSEGVEFTAETRRALRERGEMEGRVPTDTRAVASVSELRTRRERSHIVLRALTLGCAAAVFLLTTAGCRQDMHDQPKYIPLRPSDFFADGRSERQLIEGTVARGHLNDDTAFYTGKGPNNQPVNDFPFPITKDVLQRGQQRYNVYCSPCHDRLGTGNGMIVRRGYRHPPSYHIDRLRNVANGYIYDVMTNGFGAMPDYAAQIQPHDRWAIVAYIRVLQTSQNASVNDLNDQDRAKLAAVQQSGSGGGR